MRICWLTDIHLNFLEEPQLEQFYDEIVVTDPELVLISGDIGESHDVARYLHLFHERIGAPIYFVLGNHDYYYGSILRTTEEIKLLCEKYSSLIWLDRTDVVELNDRLALIGHSSWADGRFGDYERSDAQLNDFELIDELAGRSKAERLFIMQRLAEEAAEHLDRTLPQALKHHDEIICVTHVPPFAEASYHDGEPCDELWLPYYSCKIVGEVLTKHMSVNPQKRLTVLCGHTHSPVVYNPLENLQVVTGETRYGAPKIQYIPNWRSLA